ncbi:MAG: hypothetical protein U1F36_10595 [Planctomycetota bacterium]
MDRVRRAQISAQQQQAFEATQEAVRARARREREFWEEVQDRAREAMGSNVLDGVALGLVPANLRPLVPLPKERAESFLGFLASLIQQVEETPDEAPIPDEEHAEFRSMPLAVARAACGTCRGFCCRTGDRHAYQDIASVRSFRARHPDLDSEEIVRRYRELLPSVTYEGACVFQAEGGCALPRSMRSVTCNRFHCKDLKDLAAEVNKGVDHVFIASADDDRIQRTLLLKVVPDAGDAGSSGGSEAQLAT